MLVDSKSGFDAIGDPGFESIVLQTAFEVEDDAGGCNPN